MKFGQQTPSSFWLGLVRVLACQPDCSEKHRGRNKTKMLGSNDLPLGNEEDEADQEGESLLEIRRPWGFTAFEVGQSLERKRLAEKAQPAEEVRLEKVRLEVVGQQ